MSRIIVRNLLVIFRCLVLIVLCASSASASESVRCPVSLHSLEHFAPSAFGNESAATWRGHGSVTRRLAGEMECISVHLPSAGTLLLEVSVAGTASTLPKIDLLPQRCDDPFGRQETFRYRERYANRMELEVRARGHYAACVSAQDPEKILGEYRIDSMFRPQGDKEEDPDEHEPDADPLVAVCQKDGSNEEDPDEHEPDADPLVTPLSDDDDISRHRFCHRNDAEDHGDTFHCATPIAFGQPVSAQIRNGWGDDRDLFTLFLEELTTVHLEVAGDTGLLTILYDHAGNRLAMGDADMDTAAGGEAPPRIVKTLSPGRYFIRVEGRDRGEGSYRLEADAGLSQAP